MNNETEINSTEFINYLITNKKDIIVSPSDINFGDSNLIILTYKERNLKFEVGEGMTSGAKPVYFGRITKTTTNAEYNGGVHITLSQGDFNLLKETFIFTKDDLLAEVKSMLRGDKIDNILDKDKDG